MINKTIFWFIESKARVNITHTFFVKRVVLKIQVVCYRTQIHYIKYIKVPHIITALTYLLRACR